MRVGITSVPGQGEALGEEEHEGDEIIAKVMDKLHPFDVLPKYCKCIGYWLSFPLACVYKCMGNILCQPCVHSDWFDTNQQNKCSTLLFLFLCMRGVRNNFA